MRRALYNTDPDAWYALKDMARLRCHGVCEWCSMRPMAELHHRWGYGNEEIDGVMAVCKPCHDMIEFGTLGKDWKVGCGSLASLGDPGKGRGDLWDAYLRSSFAARLLIGVPILWNQQFIPPWSFFHGR